ncbi:MAG: hypothetical protein WC657_06565 [Candidatus Paceibacterota bacterium]|jgi:hypothetical protein
MNTPEVMEKAFNQAVETVTRARELFFKDLGKPEDLCGYEYADWTPEIMMYLQQIYGDELQHIIFERELKQVKALEKAARQ